MTIMASALDVIEVALAEVGYVEKASNASLDDPAGNPGSGNWTKYARDLSVAGWYNGNKNGFPWCCVFVSWCFYKVYGADAQRVQCQSGDLGAACVYSAQYYRAKKRFDRNPKAGDQVFFYADGTIGHTGLVVEVDAGSITVVEGNSSYRVRKIRYDRASPVIAGYGHPLYDEPAENAAPPKEIEEEPSAAGLLRKRTSSGETELSRPSGEANGCEACEDVVCVAILPLLRRGSIGAAVECAQFRLIRMGYSCGGPIRGGREDPDGDFGPLTEVAVRSFQQRAGLDPDGVLGSETWTQLFITEYAIIGCGR